MTNWTDNQKEAIQRNGSDIIVSAAAGSGKTSTMVARALRLITQEKVPVEKIMLLTYSNAAATEMFERLRSGLFEYAKNNPQDAEVIRNQLDNLYLADISTIHGFCLKVVREFFEQVGLSPSISIESEEESSEDMEKAAVCMLAQCEADAETRELMDKLSLRKDGEFKKVVKAIYGFMTVQADREQWLEYCMWLYEGDMEQSPISDYCVKYFSQASGLYSQRLRELCQIAEESGEGFCCDYGKSVLSMTQRYENCATIKDLFMQNSEGYSILTKKSKQIGDEKLFSDMEAIKMEFKAEYEDVLCKLFADYSDYNTIKEVRKGVSMQIRLLINAVRIFEKEFERIKNEQNRIDFADMERYTLQILQNPEICEELRQRHDYIFVDEYQDTNYVQEHIIRSLAQEDRIFLVGDAKQCIYRFRLAEPTIFMNTLKNWQDKGKAVFLNSNFRSRPEILSFVNRIFDLIMTDSFGGIDYKQTGKFTLSGGDLGSEIDPVVILSSSSLSETVKSEGEQTSPQKEGIYDLTADITENISVNDSEAGIIYSYVQSILGKTVIIKGKPKIIEYSDIALMYQTRKSAANTLSALLQAGVPLNLGSFEGAVGNTELDILVSYLSVIDNVFDDYSLITALHSYIGGFNNSELAQIRTAFAAAPTFAEAALLFAETDCDLGKKLKAFFVQVDSYRFSSAFTELSVFAKTVLEETGFATYIASCKGGLNTIAAINGYLRTLKDKTYSVDLHSFLVHYRAIEAPKLKAVASQENGINVCTIHASKGLEYPVVILAGTEISKASIDDIVLTEKDFGVGMSYYSPTDRTICGTLEKGIISLKKRNNEREDKVRLFYVALTRAQAALAVICDVNKKNKCIFPQCGKSFGGWLRYCLDKDKSLNSFVHYVIPHVFQKAETAPAKPPVVVDANEDVKQVLSYKYPFSTATECLRKYTVVGLNDTSNNMVLSSVEQQEERSFAGTAHHAAMQYIDLYALTEEQVLNELERMLDSGLLSKEQYAEIRSEELVKCLNSEIGVLARNSEAVRERRFVLRKKASELFENGAEEIVLIQGTIDMLLIGDQTVVVDFKRSNAPSYVLKRRYATQLRLYGEAVAQSIGRAPDRLLLYVFGRNEIIEIDNK